VRSAIITTDVAFGKNGSFDKHVLQEISGTCVHPKPRGIKATVVTGDNPTKLTFPLCATKTLAVARERGYNNFVFPNTFDDEAKTKSSLKTCPEDARYGVFTQGGICKSFWGDCNLTSPLINCDSCCIISVSTLNS